MTEIDSRDDDAILEHLRGLVDAEAFRVTQHAQQEMVEEEILLDHVLQAIRAGKILENYPDHRRGPCCLLFGYTGSQRPLHVVCTTVQPLLVLITVYEPKPPKWPTPTQRRIKP